MPTHCSSNSQSSKVFVFFPPLKTQKPKKGYAKKCKLSLDQNKHIDRHGRRFSPQDSQNAAKQDFKIRRISLCDTEPLEKMKQKTGSTVNVTHIDLHPRFEDKLHGVRKCFFFSRLLSQHFSSLYSPPICHSDPGLPCRLFSPFPTTVRAFPSIAKIHQPFLPSSTRCAQYNSMKNGQNFKPQR